MVDELTPRQRRDGQASGSWEHASFCYLFLRFWKEIPRMDTTFLQRSTYLVIRAWDVQHCGSVFGTGNRTDSLCMMIQRA